MSRGRECKTRGSWPLPPRPLPLNLPRHNDEEVETAGSDVPAKYYAAINYVARIVFSRPWCFRVVFDAWTAVSRAQTRIPIYIHLSPSFNVVETRDFSFNQHQRHVLAITLGRLFQVEKEREREKLILPFLNDFYSETAIKETIVWYSVKSNIYLKSKCAQIKRGSNLFEWKSEVPTAYERKRAKLVCKTR